MFNSYSFGLNKSTTKGRATQRLPWLVVAALMITLGPPAMADGGITYDNIADDGIGLDWGRTRSFEWLTVQAFQAQSLVTPLDVSDPALAFFPSMTGGYPGVAILDYDGDGDLDIYASNGPGTANSLFQSQLIETGELEFIDRAVHAGVDATEQDSSGVCYGDIDNDDDHDLVVLGRNDPNRMFENLGNGHFREIEDAGIAGTAETAWSTSCSFGDINGDGLIDLVVVNSVPTSNVIWVTVDIFGRNQHNELFRNNGDNTFSDVSETSGIRDLDLNDPANRGMPTVTWAVEMVDVDRDGDVDLFWADDQGGIPPAVAGGTDRGYLHVLLNDGDGNFSDQPVDQTTFPAGGWMGVASGDLDCDGTLDIFGTNFGDYGFGMTLGVPNVVPLGFNASRWFYGNGDGTYTDPGVGGLVATVFGWGTAIYDYDNDGDLDILSHGGLDQPFALLADNPGVILQNQDCSSTFEWDFEAIPNDPDCEKVTGESIARCTAHTRRNVRGVAVGDLDGNGFLDVVSAATVVIPPSMPLIPAPDVFGSLFDDSAVSTPEFFPTPEGLVWAGITPDLGDLFVEMSNENENHWVAVRLVGSVGTLRKGRVNRDALGALVSFKPRRGKTTMVPVTGGSSHLSQHSLERVFGLGDQRRGTLEILWPGGVRNRLYGVRHGERLVVPEIPCSFDTDESFRSYVRCVRSSVRKLHRAGVIDQQMQGRLTFSALIAFFRR